MQTSMSIDELKGFLLQAVGDDESVDLSGDILDVSLTELGFDSLAIIDVTSKLEQHYRIKLPEPDAAGLSTAREFLDVVNAQLARAAA